MTLEQAWGRLDELGALGIARLRLRNVVADLEALEARLVASEPRIRTEKQAQSLRAQRDHLARTWASTAQSLEAVEKRLEAYR